MKKETVADLLAALAEEGGPDCAPVETLHEWAAGSLPASRAAAVESHMARCPRCSAEARLAGWYEQTEESADLDRIAEALSAPARGVPAPAPVATSPRWWTRPWASASLAVAATLLIVAGLSLFRQPPPVGEIPAGDVVRGAAPSIVEPRGTLSARPESVGWQGTAGQSYRVELSTVEGVVLWRSDVVGERVELPAEIRAGLAERVTYRLRVTPLAPDSTPAGAGDEVEFSIVGDRS